MKRKLKEFEDRFKIEGVEFKKTKLGSKYANILEESKTKSCYLGILKIDYVIDEEDEEDVKKKDFVIVIFSDSLYYIHPDFDEPFEITYTVAIDPSESSHPPSDDQVIELITYTIKSLKDDVEQTLLELSEL